MLDGGSFWTMSPFTLEPLQVSTTPYTPISNTSQCNTFRPKNSTQPVIIPIGYAGIPQNFVINILFWMVCRFIVFLSVLCCIYLFFKFCFVISMQILIILFSVLRKKAWNYGRMALLQRRERRSCSFLHFYFF